MWFRDSQKTVINYSLISVVLFENGHKRNMLVIILEFKIAFVWVTHCETFFTILQCSSEKLRIWHLIRTLSLLVHDSRRCHLLFT